MQARRKVYVEGSRPDIRVPFAEVTLTGDNPPVRLYDTSGPGSDPDVGLPSETHDAAAVGGAGGGPSCPRRRTWYQPCESGAPSVRTKFGTMGGALGLGRICRSTS